MEDRLGDHPAGAAGARRQGLGTDTIGGERSELAVFMRGLRDLFPDIKLPEPHPAAEQLFGAAWSAYFIGAIEVAAAQKKVKLPATPEIDAQIDLNTTGGANFFRRAHLASRCRGSTGRRRRRWSTRRRGSAPTPRRSTATSR